MKSGGYKITIHVSLNLEIIKLFHEPKKTAV